MKKLMLIIVVLMSLVVTVSATEFTAPPVPETAEKYMPNDTESFSQGLWHVVRSALGQLQPGFTDAVKTCLSILAVVLLLSLLSSFYEKTNAIADIAGAVAIGVLLFQPAGSLVRLGAETVTQLSEYGKLLLPVMTATLASEGAVGTSTTLYTATALFSALLTTLITKIVIPILYIYLCLSIVNCALAEEILKNLQNFLKWAATWCLKTVLYVFTGYISITGVISGSTDAAALKATKLTISGMVPVVGGILSDASETILVSAGIMKSAVGVYGVLAMAAIWIAPFLQIGVQYIVLNITGGICSIFADKRLSSLIKDFATVMGMLLAATGAICILLLVSTICFMKGVT